jgi:hypothetical protein
VSFGTPEPEARPASLVPQVPGRGEPSERELEQLQEYTDEDEREPGQVDPQQLQAEGAIP